MENLKIIESINDLKGLLSLEQLDVNLFRGNNLETSWKRVFGGQVLGQALNAAYQSVPEDRLAHSLHGYFILPGDVTKPIIYRVDSTRDGGSFSTRRVSAVQNGKAIFVMAASFQVKQDGFDHQNEMPEVPEPDSLLTDKEQAELLKETRPDLHRKMKGREQGALEFRPVEPLAFEDIQEDKLVRNVWMRTQEKIELTLPEKHQILAYTSDYDLLLSSVYPHRQKFNVDKLFLASLDHAMWFHRDVDISDWMLFVIDSPSASNSRGMGYGRIFDKGGRLISTVMQEGLIRIMK